MCSVLFLTFRVKKIIDQYCSQLLNITTVNRTRTDEIARKAAAAISKQIEKNNIENNKKKKKKGPPVAATKIPPPPPLPLNKNTSSSSPSTSKAPVNSKPRRGEEEMFNDLFNDKGMHGGDDDLDDLFQNDDDKD